MIQNIYIDTSVIGGCLDEEFALWSEKLVDEIRSGEYLAVISDLTLYELESAPENVQNILASIPEEHSTYVSFSEEAEELADKYIKEKIVSRKHIADAQHIAIATANRSDILVSWNFKQIVNLDKIHGYNAVNLKNNFPMLEIRSPREVSNE